MKRVQAACISQTLRFLLREDMEKDLAIKAVDEEVAHYKRSLERTATKYRILEEKREVDGSVTIRIKKQYNQSPVGDYLD